MSKGADDPSLTVALPRSRWVALISSLAQLEPREPATDTTGARAN